MTLRDLPWLPWTRQDIEVMSDGSPNFTRFTPPLAVA